MTEEQEIQKAIMEYLTMCGHLVCRMNLGGVRHGRHSNAMGKNPLKGFPDLFFLHADRSGTMFCVEVKTPTGKMSEIQLEWKKRLEGYGVLVIVAASVDDVKRGLIKGFY